MKNWIVLFAALFGGTSLFAQNLVVNPSFEEYSSPFCGIIGHADIFSDVVPGWTAANGATPDLYFTNNAQSCYNHQPNSSYSGPITIKGTENPSQGTAMAGIWIYTINGFNQREYIQGSLSSPLQMGQQYKFSIRLSLADNIEYYVKELQVLFSKTPITQTHGEVITGVASLQISLGDDITTTDGWETYEVVFEADEAYEYFTLGNFRSDEQTEVTDNPAAQNGTSTYGAYYYVDEVAVELAGLTSTSEVEQGQLVIAPNPASSVLHFRFETPQKEELRYRLINVQGKVLASGDLGTFVRQQELDVSQLTNGLYFIQIESGNQLITRKFSIQR